MIHMERRTGVKIKFKYFLRESAQQEISKMDMKLEDIFDIYLTYDDVTEFLDKELKDKIVFVSELFVYVDDERDYLKNVTINVDRVELAPRKLIFVFIDKDEKRYYVTDDSILKWEKPITRKITDIDPYGEEEDDD